jgi:hypothetical protein
MSKTCSCATMVEITVEEQMREWLAAIRAATTLEARAVAYQQW